MEAFSHVRSTASSPRSRRSRAKVARPVPAPTSEPSNPEEAFHDILSPMAAMCVETSARAYKWGLAHRQLLRASQVVDLCGEMADRAYQILGHTTGQPVVVATGNRSAAR